MKARRLSHGTAESASRDARRKSALQSGVSKSSSEKQRRRSMGGMIGDRVFIPGSPIMTLPELLTHAEEDLDRAEENLLVTVTPVKVMRQDRDPFKTPAPHGRSAFTAQNYRDDKHAWTKEDWKQLDACFTDERLDVAEKLGSAEGVMADVEDIRIEDVVERFVVMMGGDATVNARGSLWDRYVSIVVKPSVIIAKSRYRDSLCTRARALQKKQRSGNVAPPTPRRGATPSSPLSVVPDFTPITRRRPHPPALRPKLPPPLARAPFDDIPNKTKVHGSLLAPRYSHLLEEAIAVSQDQPVIDITSSATAEAKGAEFHPDAGEQVDDNFSRVSADDSAADQTITTPEKFQSGISKVKGFFTSYLPTLSKSAPPKTRIPRPGKPGLPLPPPEVLGKTRGPISTPARQPLPKVITPKEQVYLHHTSPPKKPTLRQPTTKPQRLVELNPTPLPVENINVPAPRNRRSSGGSVKDLVRNFEVMDSEAAKKPEVQRIGSIRNLKGLPAGKGKASWRP